MNLAINEEGSIPKSPLLPHVCELKTLRGYCVEMMGQGESALISKGAALYSVRTPLHYPRLLGNFPLGITKTCCAAIRPTQRALGLMYQNVLPLGEENYFITFSKAAAILSNGKFNLIRGLEDPICIPRSGACLAADGSVYFGEHFGNPDRGEVYIYRLAPGADEVEVVYVFSPGALRHVHAICADPFDDSLWCLSGDDDYECRLMRTSDCFKTVEIVGSGDQSWNAKSICFSRDCIFYGTSSRNTNNKIFALERSSGKRYELAELPGPVYYSCTVGENHFFGVTAELCPSQVDRHASVWWLAEDGKTRRIFSREKDPFHRRYFLSGLIHFPRIVGKAEKLIFSAVGLEKIDNRCFEVSFAS